MKFLLDNCVTRRLADLVVASGYECERVAHWPNTRVGDHEILAYAVSHHQVLVTLDSDFDELIRVKGIGARRTNTPDRVKARIAGRGHAESA